MSIEKDRGEFKVVCDECGDHMVGSFGSFDTAVKAKKRAGWRSRNIDGEWHDQCPDCQRLIDNNK